MTFVNVGSDKSNSPMRTAAGLAWSDLPATGNTEVGVQLPSCATCPKLAAHNPCSRLGWKVAHGDTSYGDVSSGSRVSYREWKRIFQAAWQLAYVFQGMIGDDIIFNAGEGGDNASQFFDFEIVSVSGATLTLKGDNPKRLTLGRSIPNPDPFSGGGALSTVTEYFALRLGARVEFRGASVLRGKLAPYITSITPPVSNAQGNVTFTVTLSSNVSNAKQPYDAFYPPADGKYYCRVRFYQFHDPGWPNCQPPIEALFSRVTQSITRAAAVGASGEPELLDTDGDPTRVIPPGVDPATAPTLVVEHPDGDFSVDPAGRIVTVQNGYLDWTTTLDVSDLLTAYPAATGFVATFRAESVAADAERIPHRGQCGNCQKDETGSYAHHDGWRCTQVACSGFASFKRNCWQPNASHFNLANEEGGYNAGNANTPAADVRNGTRLARLFTGVSWVIIQGIPGESSARNFHLELRGIPGLQEILGAWAGGVPSGLFASQTPFYSPALGIATWGTDGSGNDTVSIAFGAFNLRNTWTAGDDPEPGILPTLAGSWEGQESATGGADVARLNGFPAGWTGHTHLYSLDTSGSAYALTNRRVEQEVFVTGIDPDNEDDTFAAQARSRAAGL